MILELGAGLRTNDSPWVAHWLTFATLRICERQNVPNLDEVRAELLLGKPYEQDKVRHLRARVGAVECGFLVMENEEAYDYSVAQGRWLPVAASAATASGPR